MISLSRPLHVRSLAHDGIGRTDRAARAAPRAEGFVDPVRRLRLSSNRADRTHLDASPATGTRRLLDPEPDEGAADSGRALFPEDVRLELVVEIP
jgi:hypothetical protein